MPEPVDFLTIEEIFDQIGGVFAYIYHTYLEPFVGPYVPFIKTVSIILSLVLFAGIVFAVLRFRAARIAEYELYRPIDIEKKEATHRQTRWQVVHDHLDSENPAEWKLGILEADMILDDVLFERGFQGEGLGERLRSMTDYDLKSIQSAWEAHKVRNAVAHQGSGFDLTKRTAQKTISLYETVLRELGYF